MISKSRLNNKTTKHFNIKINPRFFCKYNKLYIHIYTGVIQKSSKPYPERKVIAEHFCCGKTLLFLVKLENKVKISVLIYVQLRPI